MNKMSQGKLENGNQKFYVSLRSNGGKVTINELSDIPGNGLEFPDEITIEDCDGISDTDLAVGKTMSFSDFCLKLKGLPMERAGQLGFSYTARVKDTVGVYSNENKDDYKNKIKVEYTNNAGIDEGIFRQL